jgi:hypothetical protein
VFTRVSRAVRPTSNKPAREANLSLITRGDKQSVTIKSQNAQAEVQRATINLQRG